MPRAGSGGQSDAPPSTDCAIRGAVGQRCAVLAAAPRLVPHLRLQLLEEVHDHGRLDRAHGLGPAVVSLDVRIGAYITRPSSKLSLSSQILPFISVVDVVFQ